MRKLYVKRERVLACFAIPYHCVIGRRKEEYLGWAVVFTGGDDPWVGGTSSRIPTLCREREIPCHVLPGANHSLETGDCPGDIRALSRIMEDTARFLDQPLP